MPSTSRFTIASPPGTFSLQTPAWLTLSHIQTSAQKSSYPWVKEQPPDPHPLEPTQAHTQTCLLPYLASFFSTLTAIWHIIYFHFPLFLVHLSQREGMLYEGKDFCLFCSVLCLQHLTVPAHSRCFINIYWMSIQNDILSVYSVLFCLLKYYFVIFNKRACILWDFFRYSIIFVTVVTANFYFMYFNWLLMIFGDVIIFKYWLLYLAILFSFHFSPNSL